MDKLAMETKDITNENIEKILELFPNVATEGVNEDGKLVRAIDFEKLKQELSHNVIDGEESYDFTWVGKKEAMLEANSPIRKTLRPDKESSLHWDTTENIYIEGDNLDALKLLQESYLGKVKMIYIDPPYNTGKNYIYKNNYVLSKIDFSDMVNKTDEKGNLLFQNTESNGRFHSDWCSMIYPRLRLARNLLSKEGILVCAIDENEFATLSLIIKELFSEEAYEHSYVSIMHNPRGQQGINFSYVNEYLIFVYPKNGNKYLADFPKNAVDSRGLRDSGTESNRTDAKSCFYPFYVKDNKIIGIGEVPKDDFHPKSANMLMDNGIIAIYPLTDSGEEKKWRYARQTVEKILDKLEIKKGRNSLQVIFNKDTETMRSIWINSKYDSSEYGTKLLDKLFGGASFTFPKSLYAVYDCIKAAMFEDKDGIVLDFFSGSATTAHACMQLNSDDGGNRKFIMIQLPENLDKALERNIDDKTKSAVKSAIKFLDSIQLQRTICKIGEERIRRAGKKIQEENPDKKLDIGFRVFKVDDTNMKDVYYSPHEFKQDQLDLFESNIKDDRSDEDLLYEVLLNSGVELSLPHKVEIIDGMKVHFIQSKYSSTPDLIACFEDKVSETLVRTIAQYKPTKVVFRDSCFKGDSNKINIEEIFKLITPDTRVKVL